MDAIPWLLGWSAAQLALALAWTLRARARARGAVGEVLDRSRVDPSRQPLLALGAGALAGLAVPLAGAPHAALALLVVVLATALALAVPDDAEAVCGTRGVRRGWHARRLEELEEWRLAGDHLRFRLRGEWTSVPLARERHPAVRVRLVERAGERESRFSA